MGLAFFLDLRTRATIPRHSVRGVLCVRCGGADGCRWAAKEAAYKALFPSYRVTWKTLNVRKEGGKPVLELLGEGEELRVHLSLSHDGEYVVAYVVVEREGG